MQYHRHFQTAISLTRQILQNNSCFQPKTRVSYSTTNCSNHDITAISRGFEYFPFFMNHLFQLVRLMRGKSLSSFHNTLAGIPFIKTLNAKIANKINSNTEY